jgi:DNA-binding CsgD family transcriptional regulator
MFELQLNTYNLRVLMGIMHDCVYVKTQDDIMRILEILDGIIPFNAAILCRNNRASVVMSIDGSVNHSYPQEWVQNYSENNFGQIDPVALVSAKTAEPFKWETAYRDVEMTSELKEFIGVAEDYGMKAGIACSRNASFGESVDTLMSLETYGYKVGEEYLAIVEYILPHLHEAIGRIDIANQIPKDLPNFTLRERETLKWSYEGKTAWEIGIILSISERTVKFHLKNIYQKLNVTNRSQAVAKAIRCGVV